MVITAAGSVVAAPDPDDPCAIIKGPARKFCDPGEGGGGSGSGTAPAPGGDLTSSMDPLSELARACGEGAAWVVDRLSDAVVATADVDFTNPAFLKNYAIVFASATFLVLLLWLWAVCKRVVRGAPMATAFGEAFGLLWVTVLASAFTPLILYTLVSAVDGITAAISGGSEDARFFEAFSRALDSADSSGGPITTIVVSLVSMAAAGIVWLEMTVRAALLYVGAALGTVVYAGLVDRDLWGRVRRYAGIMAAIILVKPIIVIVLRLASALSSGGPHDTTGAIVSGLSIILIAILASSMLFRLIPGMGDDIVAARREAYDPASRAAAAVVTRPVSGITAGINTHASRDAAAKPTMSSSSQTSTSSGASGGMSAHATRPTRSTTPPPRRDDARGSGT